MYSRVQKLPGVRGGSYTGSKCGLIDEKLKTEESKNNAIPEIYWTNTQFGVIIYEPEFIHSFIPAISIAPLQVLYRRSRLQHGYCIGVSRRSAQATAGKGLAQGPYIYVAARAGVEPTTLRLKAIDSTNAPPRPTTIYLFIHLSFHLSFHISIHLSIYPFILPPIHPFIHPSINPSIDSFIYTQLLEHKASILPYTHPHIHPFHLPYTIHFLALTF